MGWQNIFGGEVAKNFEGEVEEKKMFRDEVANIGGGMVNAFLGLGWQEKQFKKF